MTNITTLRSGEHFVFKNFEWVCLDPNHPDGGVLAIMAEPWAKDVKFCPDEQYVDEKGNWNKEHVRLIDANALKKRVIKVMFRDCPESGEFYAVGTGDIDIMPTIDPESLRPTAHWENEEDFNGDPVVWFCSACKERFLLYDGTPEENDYKYCPYCGARMVNTNE